MIRVYQYMAGETTAFTHTIKHHKTNVPQRITDLFKGENFQYIKACDPHCKKKAKCKPFRDYFEPRLFSGDNFLSRPCFSLMPLFFRVHSSGDHFFFIRYRGRTPK